MSTASSRSSTFLGNSKKPSALLRHVLLIGFALFSIYPLLWLVSGSFKNEEEVFTPSLIPSEVDWGNYVQGWTSVDVSFGRYLLNTLLICGISVLGNVITTSMAAYAFARLNFVGRKPLFVVMLATLMLPIQVVIIPQYILFNALGMVGTYLPLLIPKFLAVDAFFIFLLVQFIRGLPVELTEAATIDGAGPIRIYFSIILPLIGPALVTVSIFTFIWTWNDFFSQLIYITNPRDYTVSLGLRLFVDATGISSFGPLFAMVTLATIPVTVIFLIFQRRLVQGVATTGLKG